MALALLVFFLVVIFRSQGGGGGGNGNGGGPTPKFNLGQSVVFIVEDLLEFGLVVSAGVIVKAPYHPAGGGTAWLYDVQTLATNESVIGIPENRITRPAGQLGTPAWQDGQQVVFRVAVGGVRSTQTGTIVGPAFLAANRFEWGYAIQTATGVLPEVTQSRILRLA